MINPTLENPSGLDVDPLSKEKSDGEESQMDIEVGCKGSLWSEGMYFDKYFIIRGFC